jgi:hypothetical protein
VGVSGAKLSRPFFLRQAGRCKDQRLDPRDHCSWGRSRFRPQPNPFMGRGHQPLGESAQAHFHLVVSISASLMHTHSYAGSWVCT